MVGHLFVGQYIGCKSPSQWIQQKSYRVERFQSAQVKTYMLTEKLELIEGYDD